MKYRGLVFIGFSESFVNILLLIWVVCVGGAYMWVHICGCVCPCGHVWKSEVDFGLCSLLLSSTLLFEAVLQNLESVILARLASWLASKTTGSSCLYPPAPGLQVHTSMPSFFMWVLGVWTQGLLHMCQALYPLSHLQTSVYLLVVPSRGCPHILDCHIQSNWEQYIFYPVTYKLPQDHACHLCNAL